jgi:hypothetical protein
MTRFPAKAPSLTYPLIGFTPPGSAAAEHLIRVVALLYRRSATVDLAPEKCNAKPHPAHTDLALLPPS